MDNIFESKSDKAFVERKNALIKQLSQEYKSRIERAAVADHVRLKIFEEINERKRLLYSSTKLLNEVNNQYKYSLILRFKDVLKEEKENPVEAMIISEIPKLQEYHRQQMKRSEFSYSFDKLFINAGKDKIISLLANYWAFEDYSDSLFTRDAKNKKKSKTSSPTLGHLPKDASAEYLKIINQTKKDEIISHIHEHLTPSSISISLEQFKLLFQPNSNPVEKVQWHDSTVLIVRLFDFLVDKPVLSSNNSVLLIVRFFKNKKGKDFNAKQLYSVRSQMSQRKATRNSNKIALLMDALNTLLNSK